MKTVQNFLTISTPSEFEAGFDHFSPAHFAHLLLICAAGAAICLAYRAGTGRRRRTVRIAVAASTVALALLRAVLLAAVGEYGIWRLPLHLCGMAVYICFFHALRPGAFSGQFILSLCMPGAAAALLFPDWTDYPPWGFMSLSCFAIHGLIVVYGLMQALSGDIRRQPRLLPACLGVLLLIALPVYAFNLLTGTNYMFLNYPAPDSPLEFFAFLGRPGYILGYLPMLAAVWALMYLPRRRKCSRKRLPHIARRKKSAD